MHEETARPERSRRPAALGAVSSAVRVVVVVVVMTTGRLTATWDVMDRQTAVPVTLLQMFQIWVLCLSIYSTSFCCLCSVLSVFTAVISASFFCLAGILTKAYVRTYIHTCVYIYIHTHTHTHKFHGRQWDV